MKTLFMLAMLFIGSALGLPFGWWLRGKHDAEKLRGIASKLDMTTERLSEALKKNQPK